MGNDLLSLSLSVGLSIVLVLKVLLGCLEALKFSSGNTSVHTCSYFQPEQPLCPGALCGDGMGQVPAPFSLGELSPGSWQ